MKKLATFALVSLAIFALAMPAVAQPEVGDVGVFFDTAGTLTTKNIAGFAVDFFYVMGYGLGQYTGFEAGVNWSDPSWNILGATLRAGALNVGTTGNFIVGLGACVAGGTGFTTLVTYQVGYFAGPVAPSDVAICIGPATPSSFGVQPGGYSSCTDVLTAFGLAENGGEDYPNGCGVINATGVAPVSTETASIGAVKAKF